MHRTWWKSIPCRLFYIQKNHIHSSYTLMGFFWSLSNLPSLWSFLFYHPHLIYLLSTFISTLNFYIFCHHLFLVQIPRVNDKDELGNYVLFCFLNRTIYYCKWNNLGHYTCNTFQVLPSLSFLSTCVFVLRAFCQTCLRRPTDTMMTKSSRNTHRP